MSANGRGRSRDCLLREIPDRVHIAPYLGSSAPWDIHYYPALDSTNRTVMDMALRGAPHGRVVTAGEQHAGRGRLGRVWHSPPDVNLYLSVLLRPTLEPSDAALLNFAAALSAGEALASLGIANGIKWPNDIVLGDRYLKVGGILSEMRAEHAGIEFVVIGLGINLNMPATSLPDALRSRATSTLAFTGRILSRARVAAGFLSRLEKWMNLLCSGRRARVMAAWRERSITLGRRVEVSLGSERVCGRAVEVDDDGTLWIEEGVRRRAVRCGDVQVIAAR